MGGRGVLTPSFSLAAVAVADRQQAGDGVDGAVSRHGHGRGALTSAREGRGDIGRIDDETGGVRGG